MKASPQTAVSRGACARLLLWLGVAWLAGSGCGAAVQTPERELPSAELRVIAEPEAAVVYIDERFVGTARVLARSPARLEPGAHRMSVSAPGWFPHDLDLTLSPGLTTVRIKLREVPP